MDRTWAGYAAMVWALVFAALHLIWAGGWYVALDPVLAAKAFQKPWFLAYDLAVAALCLTAAWVGLALARFWNRRLAPAMGYAASAILTIRGVAGLVADGPAGWNLWFCLGGLLFGVVSSLCHETSVATVKTGGTV